jgi:hypothetical protein
LKLSRRLAVASAIALGGLMSLPVLAGPAGAAAPKAHPASAQATALRQPVDFLRNIKIGQPLIQGKAFHQVPGVVTKGTSTNWSGYVDQGAAGAFTTVSGSWTEPKAKCGSAESWAAFWVGIDGISSADETVQQDGTVIECLGGKPTYFTWWETWPGNDITTVGDTVAPGDKITATVTFAGGKYTMKVTDSTHSANSFSVTAACGASACENMSSEWIAEAPCCKANGQVLNLTNFASWTVSKASTTYDGTLGTIKAAPTVDELTMIDAKSATKSRPSALNAAGTGFRCTWTKSN